MGHDEVGRLDKTIMALTNAIAEESARTRRELKTDIASVRSDASAAHERIRTDLTEFIGEATVQQTLLRADVESHRRRLDALERRRTPTQPPSLPDEAKAVTRREVAIYALGMTTCAGIIAIVYKALPALAALMKAN